MVRVRRQREAEKARLAKPVQKKRVVEPSKDSSLYGYFQKNIEYLERLKLQREEEKKKEDERKGRQERREQILRKKIGLETVGSTKDSWFGFRGDEASSSPRRAESDENEESSTAGRRRRSSIASTGSGDHRKKELMLRLRHSATSTSPDETEKGTALCTSSTIERLSVPAARDSIITGCYERDYAIWKKRHKYSEGTKVFQILGGYTDIARALKRRGWEQSKNLDSPFFDFRFVLKGRDVAYNTILPHQIANHFQGNTEITTKIGLAHNVRAVQWLASVSQDFFFPRCYDMSDPEEYEAFEDDFIDTAAESILRLYLRSFAGESGEADVSICPDKITVESAIRMVNFRVQQTFRLRDDDFVDSLPAIAQKDVSVEDVARITSWGTITTYRKGKNEWGMEDDDLGSEKCCWREGHASKQRKKISKKKGKGKGGKVHEPKKRRVSKSVDGVEDGDDDDDDDDGDDDDGDDDDGDDDDMVDYGEDNDDDLIPAESAPKMPIAVDTRPESVRKADLPGKEWIGLAKILLDSIEEVKTQYGMDGTKNVWIVKPGRKSRGRGIQCFNNLDRIRAYVGRKSGQQAWVCQKYCENPLVIRRKKFDIRQWVVVAGFDPLTVFFYNDAYLRFCSIDFTLDDVENRHIHLANNCVQKHAKEFSDAEFEGNMLHTRDFAAHLIETYGEDLWNTKIQPMMKQITIWSLQCVEDVVQHRKNSFELFGYDFMVDENFNVWLIEVNTSPDLSYSTPVTKELVECVSEDLIKVVVDCGFKNMSKLRVHEPKVHDVLQSMGIEQVVVNEQSTDHGPTDKDVYDPLTEKKEKEVQIDGDDDHEGEEEDDDDDDDDETVADDDDETGDEDDDTKKREMKKRKKPSKKKPLDMDLGKFELIHRGIKSSSVSVPSVGSSLFVAGKAIAGKKRKGVAKVMTIGGSKT
eukprot:TRINITY_DN680_c1_g2_i2.p1 TRINITY_DN680_c1_g2~~TRINITY_DN680_c1_g2_i2.p1  ORF type:complete len:925 (+),score=308.11 TRINITY_DN680_c1_g2_i2:100-2874(+)